MREINWVEKSETLESLLEHETTIQVVPLDSGLEAEVVKIATSTADYVLKVWNKESKPNVRMQYQILKALYSHGRAVSVPLGCGTDRNGNPAMLMSYDGTPVQKVDQTKLMKLAKMLMDIHKLPLDSQRGSGLKRYDFISYFYPRIDEFPDIKQPLMVLVQRANMKQDCVIHGDYHLGNILENENELTVIDWTNVQMGDARYDMAWSIILMRIYVSEKRASFYRAAFCAENRYEKDELELFEAIACLRWVLLSRVDHPPIRKDTISRVRSILLRSNYLKLKLDLV
ncbi:aminoglycoside phosphotransferase family protein [Paenibacillus sp. ISL-20]|uniref:phosphotransferase family protein n=1 Tax=Paenibacillus sp. ISL-20 TaxID=2819163 RepID=UPI002035797A|nr:aminoglycoside phosphotransferase family protein [Paenibacillus sp. ISL-20]